MGYAAAFIKKLINFLERDKAVRGHLKKVFQTQE